MVIQNVEISLGASRGGGGWGGGRGGEGGWGEGEGNFLYMA